MKDLGKQHVVQLLTQKSLRVTGDRNGAEVFKESHLESLASNNP